MDFNQHDSISDSDAVPTTSTNSRQTRVHRRVPLVAAAAALLLVLLAAAIFGLRPHGVKGIGGHPSPTSVPTATIDTTSLTYTASDILSPTNAWAVGYSIEGGNTSAISHFDGNKWQVLRGAVFTDSQLNGISMDSADDGWAVGVHYIFQNNTNSPPTLIDTKPLLVHYTQGHWVPQILDMPNTSLFQVQMFGPDDGWATGKVISTGPLFLHYQHGVWASTTFAPTAAATDASFVPQSILPPGESYTIATQVHFLSDTEGWALGQDKTSTAVLWHFHNGKWQTVFHVDDAIRPAPMFLGLGVNSATDVWVLSMGSVNTASAGGGQLLSSERPLSNGGLSPTLLHYDGHTWTSMQADIAAGAPFLEGATWLARYDSVNNQQLMVVGLLLNQSGRWTATIFPQPVANVFSATVAPDGSTLVVATYGNVGGPPQTLHLLRYAGGKWSNG